MGGGSLLTFSPRWIARQNESQGAADAKKLHGSHGCFFTKGHLTFSLTSPHAALRQATTWQQRFEAGQSGRGRAVGPSCAEKLKSRPECAWIKGGSKRLCFKTKAASNGTEWTRRSGRQSRREWIGGLDADLNHVGGGRQWQAPFSIRLIYATRNLSLLEQHPALKTCFIEGSRKELKALPLKCCMSCRQKWKWPKNMWPDNLQQAWISVIVVILIKLENGEEWYPGPEQTWTTCLRLTALIHLYILVLSSPNFLILTHICQSNAPLCTFFL